MLGIAVQRWLMLLGVGVLFLALLVGEFILSDLGLGDFSGVYAVAALIVIVLYCWLFSPMRRRSVRLRRIAERRGFSYERKSNPFSGDPDFDRRRLELLWRPDTTYWFKVQNVIRGRSTLGEVRLFDFSYKFTAWYEQTVAAFSTPESNLPEFSLEKRGLLDHAYDGAKSALGLVRADIDFDSHPDFMKRYRVRGVDEEAVRACFTPAVLECWVSTDPKSHLAACGAGTWLLVYRNHRLVSSGEIEKFLAQCETIAKAMQAVPGRGSAGSPQA